MNNLFTWVQLCVKAHSAFSSISSKNKSYNDSKFIDSIFYCIFSDTFEGDDIIVCGFYLEN